MSIYKPVFTLAGNKSKMVDVLKEEITYLPKPFTQYVELFGGTLSLLNNINLNHKPVIVNDYNPQHYQFYLLVKNDLQYVLDSIDEWVKKINKKNNKTAFKQMHKAYLNGDVSVLPIFSRLTFFSTINNKNPTQRTNYTISSTLKQNIIDSIVHLHHQLTEGRAKIYNLDLMNHENIRKIVKNIKPGAFVFLDPPYVESSTNSVYGSKFRHANEGFIDLIYAIHNKGAFFMLTNLLNKTSKQIYTSLNIPVNIKTIQFSKYKELVVTNF